MIVRDQIRAMRNILKSIYREHDATHHEASRKRMYLQGQVTGMQVTVNCLTYCDNPEDAALWKAFEKELIELMKQS